MSKTPDRFLNDARSIEELIAIRSAVDRLIERAKGASVPVEMPPLDGRP